MKEAKSLFEEVIAQAPNTLEGSALTSLGTLYYKVPGWPVAFGDKEKAEQLLKQALTVNPNGIDANYFYGDFCYKKAVAQRQSAIYCKLSMHPQDRNEKLRMRDVRKRLRTYWRASSNLMRLLLVEDDTLLGESMQVALSRQGYTVDWLERGGGVVTALKTEQFTALILDLTLPDMDGLEVLRQIRRAGYTLPVMILTARDDISDRVKGLDGGADEYIGKPFALEELLARLRLIIRRSSGSAEELISVGELDLSLSKQEIYYAQQALKLTRNEYKILASLMTQAGRVMSKELLQQALHGWDEGSSDNAIEVHIHNLRKKLPDNLVKNVRGVGYMIEK